MKTFWALSLVILMLARPLWPIAAYISNYDYIVTELCQNRAKPALNCDGKCYLAQMFAKASGDQHSNPFAEGKSIEMPLILHRCILADYLYNSLLPQQKKVTIFFNPNLHPQLLVFKKVQPPELA